MTRSSGPELTNFGIKDWHYNHKNKTLFISQFFGNFDPDRKRKSVGFHTPPVKGKEHVVSIHFDHSTIYPYDSRIIAGKGTLDMLAHIQNKAKVKVIILSVAPEIEPFTELEGFPRQPVMGVPMVVINSAEMELEIEQSTTQQVVETLSRLNLK